MSDADDDAGGLEDSLSKYDTVVDALKMTEPEYRNKVMDGVAHVTESESVTPVRPSKGEAKNAARKWAEGLPIFSKEEWDGATYGAIVEFSKTPTADLTRWHLKHSAHSALRAMALEAMVNDVVEEFMEIHTKYRTDKGEP